MFSFYLSYHAMVVQLQLTKVSMSPCSSTIFCLILLATIFLFGLGVPQQFTGSIHYSSNNSGDERSMYNLYSTFLDPAITPVAVALVAVT
jgi:hypothetical protein